MSFKLSLTPNVLSAVVEVCTELYLMLVFFLMGLNSAYERRKSLNKRKEVQKVLKVPFPYGKVGEQFSIIISRQWSIIGKLSAIVLLFMGISGFFHGAAIQTQILAEESVDEWIIPYRDRDQEAYCCNSSAAKFIHTQRDAIETYRYALKHGLDEKLSSTAPKIVDKSMDESIYPTTSNTGVSISVLKDQIKVLRVEIKNQKITNIYDGDKSLFETWKSKFVANPFFFQKVNSTFQLKDNVWKSSGANALVCTYGQGNVQNSRFVQSQRVYKVVIIDTSERSSLPDGTNQFSVRETDIEYSEPTPWLDTFQRLILGRLHEGSFSDKNIVKSSAYIVALHWAATSATHRCIRTTRVPGVRSRVSEWSVFIAFCLLGLLFVMLFFLFSTGFFTRNMPRFLDNPSRALSSCYAELNNLDDRTETQNMKVRTINLGDGNVQPVWDERKNLDEEKENQKGKLKVKRGHVKCLFGLLKVFPWDMI